MTVGVPSNNGPAGFVPVSPDGGWGWVVVFGSFIIHVMADGITYSFGLLFDEIADDFGESRFFVAWIPAMLVGLTLGSGPLASAITNRYGCRTATVVGSIIAAFGSAISCWATGVVYLMVSTGLIMGLGCGLMYCPAIVVVTMYFDKRRAFATGLAVCGAGLGTFIFAPLTEHLLEEYAWRGTFLIYAGLLLNCAVCGAVFRPLRMVPCFVAVINPDLVENESFPNIINFGSDVGVDGKIPQIQSKGRLNPIILPSIVETEDNDEDLAYAMNPHRKTSEHFLSELPLLKENNFGPPPVERMAITPQPTPPTSPNATGERLLDGKVKKNRPAALINVDTTVTLPTTNGNGVSPAVDPLNSPRTSLPAAPDSAVSSPRRLFSPPSLSSIFNRQTSFRPPLLGRSISTGPVPSGTPPMSISAHLARRQQLKRQAKAVEAKRQRLISEDPRRLLTRRDKFYAGSLYNLNFYKSQPDLYKTSLASIPQSLASASIGVVGLQRQISRRSRCETAMSDLTEFQGFPETPEKPLRLDERIIDFATDIWASVREMSDFSLMRDPIFLLYSFSSFLTCIGFNIPLIFLPDRVKGFGMDKLQASWVISAFGIANTIGRVVIGWLADKPWLNRLLVYIVSLTLCGLSTIFSFLCQDYPSFILYAVAFGVTISTNVSLTSVILVDLLGMEKLTSAFGQLLLFQGVASLIGPPIGGWLFDITNDYNSTFYFGGTALALSGLMLFFIPVLKRQTASPTDSEANGNSTVDQKMLLAEKLPERTSDTKFLVVYMPERKKISSVDELHGAKGSGLDLVSIRSSLPRSPPSSPMIDQIEDSDRPDKIFLA